MKREFEEDESGALEIEIEYPYPVCDDDHCESPEVAYKDIAPFLKRLAKSLNKKDADLLIYDPYFCEGSVVERLRIFGFSKVYNRKEDFYSSDTLKPDYDVLVTNPPYSGDHVEKLIEFCLVRNKPFFLLLPNYVYMKPYYSKLTAPLQNMFYVSPVNRYLYTTPKGRRQKKSKSYTSPFPTFWYCYIPSNVAAAVIVDKPSQHVVVSRGLMRLPLSVCCDFDPRKKKEKNSLKRKKNKLRKKNSVAVV